MISVPRTDRNQWLRLDDQALEKQCRTRPYRGSGPGGQRKNKVQTGVMVDHIPTGLSARAEESRSRAVNRVRALRRLRQRIASEVRSPLPAGPPAEVTARLDAEGHLRINARNPEFHVVAATVLDALQQCRSYARAAGALGLTTSQVVRFVKREPWLVRSASRVREENSR